MFFLPLPLYVRSWTGWKCLSYRCLVVLYICSDCMKMGIRGSIIEKATINNLVLVTCMARALTFIRIRHGGTFSLSSWYLCCVYTQQMCMIPPSPSCSFTDCFVQKPYSIFPLNPDYILFEMSLLSLNLFCVRFQSKASVGYYYRKNDALLYDLTLGYTYVLILEP